MNRKLDKILAEISAGELIDKITILEIKKIKINDKKINTEKYLFNASKNPKDKGPFPEYTLWYHDKELLKMEFKNPKDKKIIKIVRNDWGQ